MSSPLLIQAAQRQDATTRTVPAIRAAAAGLGGRSWRLWDLLRLLVKADELAEACRSLASELAPKLGQSPKLPTFPSAVPSYHFESKLKEHRAKCEGKLKDLLVTALPALASMGLAHLLPAAATSVAGNKDFNAVSVLAPAIVKLRTAFPKASTEGGTEDWARALFTLCAAAAAGLGAAVPTYGAVRPAQSYPYGSSAQTIFPVSQDEMVTVFAVLVDAAGDGSPTAL